ncbi:unnamed protein product [Rotaria socialis]
MTSIWYKIIFSLIYSSNIVSCLLNNSIFLNFVHDNVHNYSTVNQLYRNILQDVKNHRSVDTVYSPINVTKIRTNDYDEDYLRNSCYESGADLLYAHGFNKSNAKLSIHDVQSLLPAILYSIENPGCERKSLQSKSNSFFDVWILGLILVISIKLIHIFIFFIAGDHCLSLTSVGVSKSIYDAHDTGDAATNVRHPSLKYRLWLGLGFNAFTCGIMLGTIIYHLIPHIYEIPNEDFDYTYLLRATVVFFGVYLFFIVEKLLRFRFKIDEINSNETADDASELRKLSDASMIQMARMHGTLHATEENGQPRRHSSAPARIPLNPDSDDDEINSQSNQTPLNNNNNNKSASHHHHHHSENELPHQTRNLIVYHIINDFSNDVIYGCVLSTALAHDRLIGLVLSLMVFSEGFRRHSQAISSMGRKRGLFFLLISIFFLLLGYLIGGILVEFNQRFDNNLRYIRTEYIYSIVYGALFYTALVTLIPELNDFGHHLQIILKQTNQTSKQRRLIKTLILICQNLFLIIGVIIALVLASVWRYYHRIRIYDYIMIYYLVITLILLGSYTVLTYNNLLTNFEENLLHAHIKTKTDLDLFYRRFIESNSIDDLKVVQNIQHDNNIRDLNIKHKPVDCISAYINDNLTLTDIRRLSPALVYAKLNSDCQEAHGQATWKNILIGFIAVTFINCSALTGAIILPFRKKPAFKWILSTFIGLAVGTLTGSGIFHLIPMAFNIPKLDTYHSYLNKALFTMIAIYTFYIRDQLSRIFLNVETIICTHGHGDDDLSLQSNDPTESIPSSSQKSTDKSSKVVSLNKHVDNLIENLKAMKAAGWMIFIGDMLHNFIDGLTLGAAFMVSIGEGLRMSLPIACEEFPHELGDLAVLLSSGLTIGQAILVNFLAACSCYLGFFVGAKLGELEEFHPWIYALAGGMFVYIGLADMIPELVSMGDEIEKDYIDSKQSVTILLKVKILLFQNSGVILGVTIMFLLAKYGKHLENFISF